MKIHFTASTQNILKDIVLFRAIREAVISNGNELVRDWIEDAYKSAKKGKFLSDRAWRTIYQETSKAVLASDAVIIEASIPSFAIGYQIALAIQHKKPTLVLTNKDKQLIGPYGSSIESDLIKYRTYTKQTINDVVQEFVQDSTFKGKQKRFNFFVDQRIYNYLKGAAFAQGKTKAEILRDLVEKQMRLEQENN